MLRAAVITAGGTGARMGSEIPKQYLVLGGLPILVRTLKIFQEHPDVDLIILTTPADQMAFCQSEIVKANNLSKVSEITRGGRTRQESVFNGLRMASHSDLCLIHDAVRPLVNPHIISQSFEKAHCYGAAIAACEVTDTVKTADEFIVGTMPRENLWLAHTPQTFRTSLIIEAHEKALSDGFIGTDDSSLVERMGLKIAIVPDSKYNIKITSPQDLIVAEKLLGL
jgi:2-C-methyl-D-erythritol 4-phosphate cytidylyltransferase